MFVVKYIVIQINGLGYGSINCSQTFNHTILKGFVCVFFTEQTYLLQVQFTLTFEIL